MSVKISTDIKSGIEPATFRFVAQYLNHSATAVPPLVAKYVAEFKTFFLLLDQLGNSEIKRQQVGNQGNGEQNSSSGKKWKWGRQLPRRDATEQ